MEKSSLIDIVITWVDGGDPEWIAKKDKYAEQPRNESNSANRYRDWGLLKYWFRSIEANCSWVNRVFFVTDGQVPSWLNTKSEKLVIVDHPDFIPCDCLPTFNSDTILLNIPFIKNLSEKFIIFNDDMFVFRKTREDDFFKNALPVDSFHYDALSAQPVNNVNTHALLNNCELIMRHFTKEELNSTLKKNSSLACGPKTRYKDETLKHWKYLTGFSNPHCPMPYLKSSCLEIFELEKASIGPTLKNKFRSKDDYTEWLYRYWRLAKGEFYSKEFKDCIYYDLQNDNARFFENVRRGKYRLACINDSDESIDFPAVKRELTRLFSELFPTKSQYEK